MTKAVLLPLGFIFLLTAAMPLPAQTSAVDDANIQAVLRQAGRITLRQKLVLAKDALAHGDLVDAAKLYQEAADSAQQIGSGIDAEAFQALAGLSQTRLSLARQAQSDQDFNEAAKQILIVLKYDPKNAEALTLKKRNDQLVESYRGNIPDAATIDQAKSVLPEQTQARTLVQDGKLLYEMGRLDDAEAKLQQAKLLDPDNTATFYYLNLIQQARYNRSSFAHNADTQERVQYVEKQWVLPMTTPRDGNEASP